MAKKTEIEKKTLKFKYVWELIAQTYAMFTYTNIPFRSEFLEYELQRRGIVAIGKFDDKIMVGSLATFEYDEYGLPIGSANFMTRFGTSFRGTIGENIVVGYNNIIRTPELAIPYFADLFTEIDVSIRTQVIKSRVNPIPIATDDMMAKAINKALQDYSTGETRAIAGSNLAKLVNNGNKAVDLLELTTPEEIERVQYLSKLYDDTLRRFWSKLGQPMNSTGKMAQVNEMELQGYQTYSMIYPLTMLSERKKLIEDCNALFGTEWDVTFSEAWQHILQSNDTIQTGGPEEREDEKNDIEGIL